VKKLELTYGTPTLWMAQAREAQEVASTISDAQTRNLTFAIADRFEKMAADACARIMGLGKKSD